MIHYQDLSQENRKKLADFIRELRRMNVQFLSKQEHNKIVRSHAYSFSKVLRQLSNG